MKKLNEILANPGYKFIIAWIFALIGTFIVAFISSKNLFVWGMFVIIPAMSWAEGWCSNQWFIFWISVFLSIILYRYSTGISIVIIFVIIVYSILRLVKNADKIANNINDN